MSTPSTPRLTYEEGTSAGDVDLWTELDNFLAQSSQAFQSTPCSQPSTPKTPRTPGSPPRTPLFVSSGSSSQLNCKPGPISYPAAGPARDVLQGNQARADHPVEFDGMEVDTELDRVVFPSTLPYYEPESLPSQAPELIPTPTSQVYSKTLLSKPSGISKQPSGRKFDTTNWQKPMTKTIREIGQLLSTKNFDPKAAIWTRIQEIRKKEEELRQEFLLSGKCPKMLVWRNKKFMYDETRIDHNKYHYAFQLWKEERKKKLEQQ